MATLHAPFESAKLGVVEYRVLGPVSAFLEAKPRQLGGKRQRTVLAILLSRPNQVVSQDWLIDAVWAGEPPAAARQTLHAYVSTLRKELDGGIEREADGYVVHVEDGQLDSLKFDDLVEQGRSVLESDPVGASSTLQEALALWQGSAFGDLNGEPALINEVSRLEEARLTAIEYRIEADLGAGNHQAVVQELEALTREHPFRERLQGFLMLALYRSGRQADALRSYRRAQIVLAEELGIDPSPELQTLEEQILNQSPDLAWSPVAALGRSENRAARGYELREKIDENRYGVTHRGFQGSVGREVAVLSLNPNVSDNPDFVRRFESELQAVSQLDHPHIVPIYDYWRDPDGAFLVTAYLRGGPLSSSMADGPWNLSSTLRLVDQISSALGFAHRNGFIHGSLAIDSIGLDSDANAYITDLGLPVLQGVAGTRSTGDDVVALARIAFVLLAGENAVFNQPISEIRTDLAVLAPVFDRAFNPDPASRFQKPEDFRRAIRQAAGTDVVTASPAFDDQRRNPYKGLRAFQESDASDFHGRDALVEDLIEILATQKILTVVGPSGSGKSSLVRAGLLSALRANAIDGSGSWLITEMFPGTHPFEELEAAILRIAVDRPAGLVDDLTADARGLVRIAKQVLPNEDDQLLLVVDQFEELFSLTASESDRKLFVDALVAAVTDERSRIRVVLTLRADFFDQPLRYSNFGEVLGLGLVPVGAPTDDGLARAVAQPARDVGVDLEPGLVTRIVDDVRDEPGGLPLLQYALTEMFAQREHNTLTLAGYERSGGVLGALGKRAEEIYCGLTDDGKEAARHLFLRLVTVDELADDTRRRVRQTELKSLEINQASLDDVISRFGSFRLLSFDRDAATRTPTVEVAHEALIREWTRLRTWIDDRREDLLIHRRIQVTSRDWEDSDKDVSYLLRGSRLEQALIWQERTDIAISQNEMSFIEASIEQEKRDLAELEALEAKAARRRKAVIGVLAGGLVVAGVLGAIAVDRAGDAQITATESQARELAALATNTTDDDPERGMLLALESIKLSRDVGLTPLPDALGTLQRATQKNRIVARYQGTGSGIALSPAGDLIAAEVPNSPTLDVALIAVNTGEIVHVFRGSVESASAIPVVQLRFSPDGEFLVIARHGRVGDDGGQEIGGLEMWDLDTKEVTTVVDPRLTSAVNPRFSADGSYLAAITNEGLTVWNSLQEVTFLFSDSYLPVLYDPEFDFVGDSHEIAVPINPEFGGAMAGVLSGFDPTAAQVVFIDVASGMVAGSVLTSESGTPAAVAVDPSGARMVVVDVDRGPQLIDIASGAAIDVESSDSQALAWHPNGTMFAMSGNAGVVEVFDGSTGELVYLLDAHKSTVSTTQFASDGGHLLSSSLDQGAILWSIKPDGPDANGAFVVEGGPVFRLEVEIAGERGFSALPGRIFDMRSGDVESDLEFDIEEINSGFNRVWGWDGETRTWGIWRTSDGTRMATYDECTFVEAVSSDGELAFLSTDTTNPACGKATSRVEFVQSGELVLDLPGLANGPAQFSPASTFDGHQFLAVSPGGNVHVYSMPGGERLAEFTSDGDFFNSFALFPRFSRDGRYLAVGQDSGRIVVASMELILAGVGGSESLVVNQLGHDGNSPRPAVNSTGILATTGLDQWVRLWDILSGARLVEFQTGSDRIPFVNFSSDESLLYYTDTGGVVRSYPMDVDALLARAEAVLTRTLTDDECTQYLHTNGCED